MKIIVPMARRQTKDANFAAPSPLMNLVGRPILLRVLDVVKNLKVSEVIFIVDSDDDDLKKLISKNYKFKVRYVLQKNQKGVAHAIYGAKKYIGDEHCIILFADSIIKANLGTLEKIKEDAIIWTKQVDDPTSLGVVFTHDGLVSRLVEKPDTLISDLAMVGMYYVKSSKLLFDSIAFLIKNKIVTKGSYQLTDALQLMINKGAKISYKNVSAWYDCGTKTKLLDAHKSIIVDKKFTSEKSNVLIKPVFIEKGAVIKNSVIGPHVTIESGSKIANSIITDSIILAGSTIDNVNLKSSLVRSYAKVSGSSKTLNVKESGVIRDD